MVAVLVGVKDGRQGVESGVRDLDADGGLASGFVPQDVQVEGGEQACFEAGRQGGEDVAGVGDLVEIGALRLWIRQDGIDSGKFPGQTTEESREVRELKRKVRELEEP